MRQLKKLYRSEYTGEDIITELTYSGKEWSPHREWIGNSVINNQISNQAVVIGNGISRKELNLSAVLDHFGGLLGTQKLQTYGCNALYRDHKPDFLVVTGEFNEMVKEVADSGYCDNNVVYASAPHIQDYPGKFYLIPQDMGWNSGSTATYIAAFDGHKRIYLVGFDGQDTVGYNYNVYAGTDNYQTERNAVTSTEFFNITMKMVFDTYSNVEFIRVMPTANSSMPEEWKYCVNLRQIDFREFTLEANI
jgi:hypothetical protein